MDFIDIPPFKPTSFDKRSVKSINNVSKDVEEEIPAKGQDNVGDQKLEGIPQKAVPRRRGKGKNWAFIQKFETAKEAFDYVDKEKCWRKSHSYDANDGERRYYQCSVWKCEAGIHVYLSAYSSEINTVFKATEHDHSQAKAKRGIPDQTKEEIERLFTSGVKMPTDIHKALVENGELPLPTKIQLNNFLVVLKDKLFGKDDNTISSGQIEIWAEKYKDVPEDADAPFVAGFEENDGIWGKFYFRLSITTKRLLENALKSDLIQVEVKRCLVWKGFPVMVVGTSDSKNQFHPICVTLCSNLSEEEFKLIFNSLKNSVLKVFSRTFQPKYLHANIEIRAVADGFVAAFGEQPVRLVCWDSCIKEVTKNLQVTIKDSKVRRLIRQDIEVLQNSGSSEIFDRVQKLFFDKWSTKSQSSDVSTFCEYFKEAWIAKNSNWFEGAGPMIPSGNTGSEAFIRNPNIQDKIYDRLQSERFLDFISSTMQEWSTARNPESEHFKEFSQQPETSTATWTSGYQWSISDEPYEKKGPQTFYILAKSNKDLGRAIVDYEKKLKSKKWKNFEDYKDWSTSVWKVSGLSKESFWSSTCTCNKHRKFYSCKHTIGLGIRLGYIDAPADVVVAKEGRVGGLKRKRGRPQIEQ